MSDLIVQPSPTGDDTAAIQAAFDSAATDITIPHIGRPWRTGGLRLPSHKTITLGYGCIIEALPGAFDWPKRCLMLGDGIEKLTLHGDRSALLRMNRDEYGETEFRHAISLRGCRDVIVCDLLIEDAGGDGVYIGSGADGRPCESVFINSVTTTFCCRNGISIASGRDVTISRCQTHVSTGTRPAAGIDIEPAVASDVVNGVRVMQCIIEQCDGYGLQVYLGKLDATSETVKIEISDCLVDECSRGGLFVGRGMAGTVSVRDCHITGPADEQVKLYNVGDGLTVTLDRVTVD